MQMSATPCSFFFLISFMSLDDHKSASANRKNERRSFRHGKKLGKMMRWSVHQMQDTVTGLYSEGVVIQPSSWRQGNMDNLNNCNWEPGAAAFSLLAFIFVTSDVRLTCFSQIREPNYLWRLVRRSVVLGCFFFLAFPENWDTTTTTTTLGRKYLLGVSGRNHSPWRSVV